jgi:hypothetical protein
MEIPAKENPIGARLALAAQIAIALAFAILYGRELGPSKFRLVRQERRAELYELTDWLPAP